MILDTFQHEQVWWHHRCNRKKPGEPVVTTAGTPGSAVPGPRVVGARGGVPGVVGAVTSWMSVGTVTTVRVLWHHWSIHWAYTGHTLGQTVIHGVRQSFTVSDSHFQIFIKMSRNSSKCQEIHQYFKKFINISRNSSKCQENHQKRTVFWTPFLTIFTEKTAKRDWFQKSDAKTVKIVPILWHSETFLINFRHFW